MLNRPPPYFPQNQLSPVDENRYRKFKLIVAGLALVGIAIIAALIFGLYYLITWIF
jgi:predicted secreted protein